MIDPSFQTGFGQFHWLSAIVRRLRAAIWRWGPDWLCRTLNQFDISLQIGHNIDYLYLLICHQCTRDLPYQFYGHNEVYFPVVIGAVVYH